MFKVVHLEFSSCMSHLFFSRFFSFDEVNGDVVLHLSCNDQQDKLIRYIIKNKLFPDNQPHIRN
jgi:hypothetical protein